MSFKKGAGIMAEEKKITMKDLDYPACLDEIIKYMDYLDGTDEEKKAYLEMFVSKVVCA